MESISKFQFIKTDGQRPGVDVRYYDYAADTFKRVCSSVENVNVLDNRLLIADKKYWLSFNDILYPLGYSKILLDDGNNRLVFCSVPKRLPFQAIVVYFKESVPKVMVGAVQLFTRSFDARFQDYFTGKHYCFYIHREVNHGRDYDISVIRYSSRDKGQIQI